MNFPGYQELLPTLPDRRGGLGCANGVGEVAGMRDSARVGDTKSVTQSRGCCACKLDLHFRCVREGNGAKSLNLLMNSKNPIGAGRTVQILQRYAKTFANSSPRWPLRPTPRLDKLIASSVGRNYRCGQRPTKKSSAWAHFWATCLIADLCSSRKWWDEFVQKTRHQHRLRLWTFQTSASNPLLRIPKSSAPLVIFERCDCQNSLSANKS